MLKSQEVELLGGPGEWIKIENYYLDPPHLWEQKPICAPVLNVYFGTFSDSPGIIQLGTDTIQDPMSSDNTVSKLTPWPVWLGLQMERRPAD